MKLPSRGRQYGLRFDLTPLNDIVFLLIIFLVASPHFKPSDEKDEVELAKVDVSKGDESESERRLEITVTRAGEVLIAGKPVNAEQLQQTIREAGDKKRSSGGNYEVRLRLDRRSNCGQFKLILKSCVEAGIVDIKFAVLPATGG